MVNPLTLRGSDPRRRPILAESHPDNELRLRTLKSYNVLDSDAEADFDDIVALASEICEVPVSLISLVDSDRQWFKAQVGFSPSQTPLDQSVCSHAILQDDILVIEDMSKDPRTADNTLHTLDPNVHFYAGANLRAPNGMPIGTLCILDTKPRTLSQFQRNALKTLSQQVMVQLELRKRLREEVAMRSETDHRVRNSLQTIASIIKVSAKGLTDPAALDVLHLVERRLAAVAALHSELMEQDGSGAVDAQTYLARVGALLADISPAHISVVANADADMLTARHASAVGMIASEFCANAIKHAFPDDRIGRVTIHLQKRDALTWVLTCQDDGIGIKAQARAAADDNGLGTMLMASAAAQLGADIEPATISVGTALRVIFHAE